MSIQPSATASASAPLPSSPIAGSSQGEYQPGVCNIGSAEIARRRRSGQIGLLITVVVLAVLVAANVPPLVRLIIALPAAGAAAGYLQAIFHFCAGFAARGVFNFGQLGTTDQVADPDARRRDQVKARQLLALALAIGAAAGVVAVVVPL